MKKSFIVMFVLVLMAAVSYGLVTTSSGIGSPYGQTPTAANEVYKDLRTGQLWKSLSTTKGDWEKLSPIVADGSTVAPFTTLTLQPSDYPSVKSVGTVFLASTSLKLKMCTDVASNTWVDLN